MTIDVSHMPTIDDLREIVRHAFAAERGEERASPRGTHADLSFAHYELRALGRVDVYDAEFRRHELLRRGFTPPDDLSPYEKTDQPRGV